MNSDPLVSYLTYTPFSTFKELFERVLVYEELNHIASPSKWSNATGNTVNDYAKSILVSLSKTIGTSHRTVSHVRRRSGAIWRTTLKRLQRWFNSLLEAEIVVPRTQRIPPNPGDEDKVKLLQVSSVSKPPNS